MKSLSLIDRRPKYHDFLIEFTPESGQPWMGHYSELLAFLEAELGGDVDITDHYAYHKITKLDPKDATILQRVYPNG